MKIRLRLNTIAFLLLLPLMSFGFDLAVSHTNETCAGNGTLTFTPSNTIPGGTIVYFIYKLPDTATPYASGPANTLNGLTAGNYRIIARETVGSNTTQQQVDVTITSSFVPLTYTVEAINESCANTSTLSVDVLTGTGATYAIISGPATFPPQASNTFSGLASGLYRIKVTDSCGNSVVQAFTVNQNPTVLTTGNPSFTDPTPSSCNFVVAHNTIVPSAGAVIAYPLQVHYILHLPSGDSHINMTLNSGDPLSQDISQTIPYFPTQNYIYDVILTDACGVTHPLNNFIVHSEIQLSHIIQPLPCNRYYFTLDTSNFSGSYNLNFSLMPAGFNPASFNSNYPGPYTQNMISFGNDPNVVPPGDYEVTATDACGKTKTIQFTIEADPPVPIAIESASGCLSSIGQINVSIANTIIVVAIITSAPANYPFPVPHNVSALIDNAGALTIPNIPLGPYTFHIEDDCGNVYDPVNAIVPPLIDAGTKLDVLQGCGNGMASIKLISNNSKLVSVKVTAAPAAYGFSLPHDISNHIISNGELYLANLPTGSYTFSTLDECNFTSNTPATIDGYAVSSSSFSLVPDCGVFNIPLNFVDNITEPETFWLQKLLDPVTNTWGHPVTEVPYANGTVPDATNSFALQNNATTFNLTFNGTFRLVHHFRSFNSGSDINSGLVPNGNKDCVEILSPTLSFDNALAIKDVLRIPCSSTGNFDVVVITNGPPPLHFSIIEKDGLPMVIDNGNSNIFLNLSPGIYKFMVEDNCGNSVTRTFDVSDLGSLVTIYPICNMVSCTPSITGNETFDLSTQSPIIMGIQSTADYTLSYHLTQADADGNSNPITNLTTFNPPNNPQTVYIRLIFNQLPNCYQTGSFDVISGQIPRINLAPEYIECDGLPVTLDASPGNLPSTIYSWSNGASDPAITITDIGTTEVSISATNEYGSCNGATFTCTASKDIVVNIADLPEIDHIEMHDWTDNENSITVVLTHQGDFEFSIDGINFQDGNTFQHLLPGLYTVYVRDKGGCRTVTEEIWLLNYPKFFTPNGDGINETWYIKNSQHEPDFKVYIFDRYGKLITCVLSNGPGWDGKLNGRTLFSDDYWFAAYRQDGRILRGHFTLKR